MGWISWNLFLAAIPVGLGYAAAWLGQALGERSRPWLWAPLGALLIGWLIFLPNSSYLFTEPRHLLSAVERHDLWTRAHTDPWAAKRLAFWLGVSIFYVAAGAITFTLSVRPVKALACARGVAAPLWAGPFFALISLGVYLGLVVRLNSWDLLTRPAVVLDSAAGALARPFLLAAILLFGLFLWLVYEVLDIWVDGCALRWSRWVRKEHTSALPA
jgi:uncharacterized membrane protein